jgi:AbrB family looped-hinge helix DNA binding protein
MEDKFKEQRALKLYGSTTVGERGQVVIPAEARRDFQITPTSKLLVFGGPGGEGLIFTKAESMTELLTKAMAMLTNLEEMLRSDTDSSKQNLS